MKISRLAILSFTLFIGACHLINPYTGVLQKDNKGLHDQASFKLSRISIDSTTNAYAAFTRSQHFMIRNSPFFQIDSAAYWARFGDSVWPLSKSWEQKKIAKLSGSFLPFKMLLPVIDSIAFEEACVENSEDGYQGYIDYYSESKFLEAAINLRDSLAFESARKENTYIAYKNFLDKYPNSKQSEDAQEIYELLLYETHTRDRNKASYENFISKFPHSPYLKEAESQLFEIYTLDHRKESYLKFLHKYPNGAKSDEARLWLKHIDIDYDSTEGLFFLPLKESSRFQLLSTNLLADSIKGHIPCYPLFEPYMIYQNQSKWGMANASGQGVIPAIFHDIQKLNDELYLFKNEKRYGLIHVSGFMISDARYDSLWILNQQFLGARIGNKHFILAYNGTRLTEGYYDSLRSIGDETIAIKKQNMWSLEKGNDFLEWPPRDRLEFLFDSIRAISGGILAFQKDTILWLDQELNVDHKYSFDSISIKFETIQIHHDSEHHILDKSGMTVSRSKRPFEIYREGFLKKFDSTIECHLYGDTIAGIDSIKYFRPYYFKLFKDSAIHVLTASGLFDIGNFQRLSLAFYEQFEKDTFCFIVESQGLQGLIASNGDTILKPEYEELRVFDSLNIRVKLNGKYGLVNFLGETILRPEFDAITNYDNGGFTLFHNRKFGYIHEAKGIYLKAYQNESLKLVDMNYPFFSKQEDGFISLLDLKAKNEFEKVKDIDVINDSLVFFNQDFQWQFEKAKLRRRISGFGRFVYRL